MSFPDNKLPSLKGLRAVESVNRLGSFTAAADELAVTQGAISRLVRSVEQDLGVKLFERSGPKFTTTEAGARYADALGEAFQLLGAATRSVSQQSVADRLTISVPPSFAAKWLTPRLGAFLALCPKADLRISISQQPSDFDDGVDLSIRHGLGNWRDVHCQPLISETLFPVCSPEFVTRHGPLATIQNLEGKPLLQGKGPDSWQDWIDFAASQPVNIDACSGTFFNDGISLYQAAMDGHGIALGRSVLVSKDMEEGRLIAPFRQELASAHGYYLVWPKDRLPPKHFDRFRRWLETQTKENRDH